MQAFDRHRRLRTNSNLRNLVRENALSVNDFIVPIFLEEGEKGKTEIESMPNYYRLTFDKLDAELAEIVELGLQAVLLFCKVPDHKKDNEGTEALNEDGLMQRAIRKIKNLHPDLLVFTDVALDPYSSYGHDGVVQDGEIANDITVSILAKMALSHAQAGADFVAPSDMMDGRVLEIRKVLDAANFTHTGIMSYSAKYASAFYGPFRDALDSAPGFGDKSTYQMDYANRLEAIRECKSDLQEGADILMVKPGMPYLDIVSEVSQLGQPVAVYQVSGEYAMLKLAADKGLFDYKSCVTESLMAFKRAGATLITSYFAKEWASWQKQS